MKTKILKKTWNKHVKALAKWVANAIISLLLISCGSTKVAVSKPAEGTSTTISVTTNNPITTNNNPNINTSLWDKQ